jgi:hypothetical protein
VPRLIPFSRGNDRTTPVELCLSHKLTRPLARAGALQFVTARFSFVDVDGARGTLCSRALDAAKSRSAENGRSALLPRDERRQAKVADQRICAGQGACYSIRTLLSSLSLHVLRDWSGVLSGRPRLVGLANTAPMRSAGGSTKARHGGWAEERGKILLRSCKSIARAVQGGRSCQWAIRRAVKRLAGKSYSDGRPVRASYNTIARAWYRWVEAARAESAAVFRMDYKPGSTRKISPALARRFLDVCAEENAGSVSGAYRKLRAARGEIPSLNAFHRMVRKVGARGGLNKLFNARRAAERNVKELKALIEGEMI